MASRHQWTIIEADFATVGDLCIRRLVHGLIFVLINHTISHRTILYWPHVYSQAWWGLEWSRTSFKLRTVLIVWCHWKSHTLRKAFSLVLVSPRDPNSRTWANFDRLQPWNQLLLMLVLWNPNPNPNPWLDQSALTNLYVKSVDWPTIWLIESLKSIDPIRRCYQWPGNVRNRT